MSIFMEAVGDENEDLENKRRRLIFRSAHRGIKEMDLIMGSFATAHVPNFSTAELAEYDQLLCNNDPDLYNWVTKKEQAPDDIANMSVFRKLLVHRVV